MRVLPDDQCVVVVPHDSHDYHNDQQPFLMMPKNIWGAVELFYGVGVAGWGHFSSRRVER